MTAQKLAKKYGAKLAAVKDCTGVHELIRGDVAFTFTREDACDLDDRSRERRWFVRPGRFPGLPPTTPLTP